MYQHVMIRLYLKCTFVLSAVSVLLPTFEHPLKTQLRLQYIASNSESAKAQSFWDFLENEIIMFNY